MSPLLFTFRQLLKRPGFTAFTIFILALGIGVNVTVFTMVNAVLIKPFPVEQPDRLAAISVYNRDYGANPRGSMSQPDLIEFARENHSFSGVFGIHGDSLVLAGGNGATPVQGAIASASLFDVLGVRPMLGRGFVTRDEQTGTNSVAVISHGMWRQRFNGETDLNSIDVWINGNRVQVVGVAPPGFRYPVETDVWLPLREGTSPGRGNRFLRVVGRLKDGVSRDEANAEVAAYFDRVAKEHPQTSRQLGAGVYDLREQMLPPPLSKLLWVLLGAVGCVLLITCTNAAGLLLVRGWSRRRELSIRSAMGATRRSIVRLMLTESLLLSFFGGVMGLAFSLFALKAVIGLVPVTTPYWIDFTPDWRVIAFTIGVSALAGSVAGLLPAWNVLRNDLTKAIRESAGTATAGGSHRLLHNGFILTEIAVSFALLIGAGLMTRSFLATQQASLGFEVENRVVFNVTPPATAYSSQEELANLARGVITQLELRPEIEIAGALHPSMPLASFSSTSLYVAAGEPDDSAEQAGNFHVAGNPLTALGISLVQGRLFDSSDLTSGRRVCLINQTMAERFFPEGAAVGRRLKYRSSPDEEAMTVIGVVSDVRRNSIHETPENQVYKPIEQAGWGGGFAVVAHTRVDPATLPGIIRDEMRAFDPGLAIDQPMPLEEHVRRNDAYWMARLNSWVLGTLSLGALIISVAGIHGLVAFSVNQRTREFGLRLALGADRRDISTLILGQGARLAGIGLAIGLVLAIALGQLMKSLLFGVQPLEPATWILSLLLIGTAIFAACWFPARRAAGTQPMDALRQE